MDSIKEQFSNLGNYFQKKILGGYSEGYHLEETQKQIFYFSKFTIDKTELYSIFQFVHTIQVRLFRSVSQILQKCIRESLSFEDHSIPEKDKIMIVYSACYLYYYANFSYEVDNTFSDYFDVNFLKFCETYKFSVKSVSKFQTYVYEFYKAMQREIKNLDYNKIKKLFKYYNPSIVKDNRIPEPKTQNGNIEILQKKLSTLITCAKERIVDMVFEIKAKSNLDQHPKEITFINSSLNTINNITKEYLDEKNNTNIFNANNTNCEELSSELTKDTSIYSKRVLSELVKYEADNVSKDYIMKLSEIIDENYLDEKLNEDKNFNVFGHFVCYQIDFTTNFIKRIPGYENITNEMTFEYIVPVKELYNLVMEVFFSISDLYFMNMNWFIEVCVKKGVPMKCACSLYSFFKKLMKLMVKEGKNALEKMNELFDKLLEIELSIWNKKINERGKKFTSICNL